MKILGVGTHRQQGNLMSLLTKIRGAHRQQNNLISLLTETVGEDAQIYRETDTDGYTDSKVIS
jgi:hypothetical protein